jgi:hypothetical protein
MHDNQDLACSFSPRQGRRYPQFTLALRLHHIVETDLQEARDGIC